MQSSKHLSLAELDKAVLYGDTVMYHVQLTRLLHFCMFRCSLESQSFCVEKSKIRNDFVRI